MDGWHLLTAFVIQREIVLNIPTAGMEEVTRAVGGCTGGDGDKLDRLSLPLCTPAWRPINNNTTTSASVPTSTPLHPATSSSSSSSTTSSYAASDGKDETKVLKGVQLAEHIRRKREVVHEAKRRASSAVGYEHVHDTDIAIASTCAHIVCTVTSILTDQIPGHLLLICQVTISISTLLSPIHLTNIHSNMVSWIAE
jgi:hypothetical protein